MGVFPEDKEPDIFLLQRIQGTYGEINFSSHPCSPLKSRGEYLSNEFSAFLKQHGV